MPREESENDAVTEAATRRIRDKFHHLESIVNGDDESMLLWARSRRTFRQAKREASETYQEHRLAVWFVEAFLVIVTFGILRHKRKKSS